MTNFFFFFSLWLSGKYVTKILIQSGIISSLCELNANQKHSCQICPGLCLKLHGYALTSEEFNSEKLEYGTRIYFQKLSETYFH